MTRDEIIRMAREEGFDEPFISTLSRHRGKDTAFYVGRFPCSEEVFMLFSLAFAAGAKVEREECAKVCEQLAEVEIMPGFTASTRTDQFECAAAIRARGNV